MRDPVPVRMGGLAADLARIGSTASNPANSRVIQVLLEETRRFIEWTALETSLRVAHQLVDMQVALTLWLHVWPQAQHEPTQRALLAHQCRWWSDWVIQESGLLESQ
jgi:hypothetical protein